MSLNQPEKEEITLNHVRMGKYDPNPLVRLLNDLPSGPDVEHPGVRDELFEILAYWFSDHLFVPATGDTDDEGHALYHRWDGGPEEWMDRFRELVQHPDELESRQWGIWFVLTDEGASVEELEDLP